MVGIEIAGEQDNHIGVMAFPAGPVLLTSCAVRKLNHTLLSVGAYQREDQEHTCSRLRFA